MLGIASRVQAGLLCTRCCWTTRDETSWEGSKGLTLPRKPGDEQINFLPGYYTASVADDSWPWTGSLEVSGESVNKISAG